MKASFRMHASSFVTSTEIEILTPFLLERVDWVSN